MILRATHIEVISNNDPNPHRLTKDLLAPLQRSMQAAADPDTKAWFEAYLRHAIEYRGIKTPVITRILSAWYQNHQIHALPAVRQLALATALIQQPLAEDKLAGIILIQKYLLRSAAPGAILEVAESLFEGGAFYDWSTTDWFCVRVLGPLVKKGGAATRIAGWKTSAILWQRRAAIVPFRAVKQDSAYDPLVQSTIATLVKKKARFIQTGVGWYLSDLSKVRPAVAAQIVEMHLDDLSTEVIRRHTKHLPRHLDYRSAKKTRA